jgi:hypothetical protein
MVMPRSAASVRRQPDRQSPGCWQQVPGGGDAGGQAEFDGGGRRDAVAGVEVLAGPQDRGEQRPEGGAAVAGHQAHGDVRVGQVGPLGDQYDVGQHGQAAAQPDGRAVDRGDHRQREAEQLLDDLRAFPQALVPSHRVVEEDGDPVQVAGFTDTMRAEAALPGTPGTGWDVAWAAAFLASDEARWITGVTLPAESGVLSVTPLMMAPRLRAVPDPDPRPRE